MVHKTIKLVLTGFTKSLASQLSAELRQDRIVLVFADAIHLIQQICLSTSAHNQLQTMKFISRVYTPHLLVV
jgi:hypothetical protein